jgi:ribonuclease P protein component
VKLWKRLDEREFRAVYSDAKKYFGRYIVLFVSGEVPHKVGFVSSKKIGRAVERNRARRLMREAFLRVEPEISTQKSYILVARKSINSAKMWDVYEDLKSLLREGDTK